MNRLAKWLIRLYPAAWRARYGDEMEALLNDTGADARTIVNLFLGSIRMQLSTWVFPKLALTLGVAGLILAGGGSLLLVDYYQSHATLEMTPTTIDEAAVMSDIHDQLNNHIQRLQTEVLSRTSLSVIINSPNLPLYPDEQKATPLEDVIENMRRDIRISIVALPGGLGKRAAAINIGFTYPDPVKAQRTVRTLVVAFQSALDRENAANSSNKKDHLEILDEPNLPAHPLKPNRYMVAAAGFMAGVLSAIFIAIVRRLRKPNPGVSLTPVS